MVVITNTSNLAADRALAYEAIEKQPETEEIAASDEQETEAKQPGNIGDHVAMYLSQIGSIPIMPQVEANRCIEKAQKGNAAAEQLETLRVIAEESGNAVDPEIEKDLMKAIEAGRRAKDKVVEGNLRLVVSIAKKYINSADSMVFMDLIQEGNIGLMRSIDSFDISRNVKFSTYATFWIRQNITRALATTDPAIRKPIYVAEGRRSVNNAKEQMQQKGLPCDDPLEIAKYMEGDAWDSLSKREQQKNCASSNTRSSTGSWTRWMRPSIRTPQAIPTHRFRSSSQAITSGITLKFQRQGRHYGKRWTKSCTICPHETPVCFAYDSDWRMVVLIPSKKSGTKWT